MASFLGMDVEDVRSLAQVLDQKAGEIDDVRIYIDRQLKSTTWFGPDQARFEGSWNSDLSTALVNVANALRQASTDANTNAQQQDEASR